jgi:ribosomal protein S12 methylthiotransferase
MRLETKTNSKQAAKSGDKKKVHFVSLGCPKNLVDTEIMLGSLAGQGYVVVEDPALADTVIVNTCGFIEDAKKESVDKIQKNRQIKKSRGGGLLNSKIQRNAR